MVGEQMGCRPKGVRLGVLVQFENRRGVWHWIMRPEVARALETLGWVSGNEESMPEEVPFPESLPEGSMPTFDNAYQLDWKGPFVLQGSRGESFLKSPAADQSGIYLFTVEYRNGYLLYMAGWTTRSFKRRLREHIGKYRKGTYTILEPKSLQNGKRVAIWRGMWTKKATNTPEMKELFRSRRQGLEPAIEALLSTFRIFLAPLKAERRVLARIEAAIMDRLYSGIKPVNTLPDKGMHLAPRRVKEKPFVVHNAPAVHLHGLPQCFEA